MNELTGRWRLAQRYEKNWWAAQEESIDLTYLKHYASELIDEIREYITLTESTSILEIGSGPAGILTFLPSGNRNAVDPLEDYFSTVKHYTDFRDNDVRYKKAMGESLPYDANSFDFIIMDNVLDHCQIPEKVIQEIHRTLKMGGIVYLRQNTYHLWGKFIRELLELAKIDKGHPHTFLKSYIERLLLRQGFTICKKSRRGYYVTWKSELKSARRIDRIKAILFATRDKTLYIAKKER